MFFTISNIFRAIYKNGNCRFYILPKNNEKICLVLTFTVQEDGRLNITSEIEEYAYPISKELLESKEPIVRIKSDQEEWTPDRYPEAVAHLIDASLFKLREYYFESESQVEHPSTEIALNELYQVLKPFLEMEEKEFGEFAKSSYDYSSIINYLINKGQSNNSSTPQIPGKYIALTVEAEFAEFYAKFKKARLVWYKIQNASSEEEWTQACVEWDSLYENPNISSELSSSELPHI